MNIAPPRVHKALYRQLYHAADKFYGPGSRRAGSRMTSTPFSSCSDQIKVDGTAYGTRRVEHDKSKTPERNARPGSWGVPTVITGNSHRPTRGKRSMRHMRCTTFLPASSACQNVSNGLIRNRTPARKNAER